MKTRSTSVLYMEMKEEPCVPFGNIHNLSFLVLYLTGNKSSS